jgi:hypothetical protein
MAGHPEATANGLALDRPPEAGDDSGIHFVMAGRKRAAEAARLEPCRRGHAPRRRLAILRENCLRPPPPAGFFYAQGRESTMELGQIVWILVVILIVAAIWYFKGRNRPSD